MATINFDLAEVDFGADGNIVVIMTYDDVTLNINGMGVVGSIANRLLNLTMRNSALTPPDDVIELTRDPVSSGRFDIPILERGNWQMVVTPEGTRITPGITFETEVVEKRSRVRTARI